MSPNQARMLDEARRIQRLAMKAAMFAFAAIELGLLAIPVFVEPVRDSRSAVIVYLALVASILVLVCTFLAFGHVRTRHVRTDTISVTDGTARTFSKRIRLKTTVVDA